MAGQVERHHKLDEIERDIVLKNGFNREIAERYGVSYDSIWRHADKLKKQPEKCREIIDDAKLERARREVVVAGEEALNISNMYNALAKRVEAMITQAEKDEKPGLALAAAEGLRKVLHDIATMQGKLAQTFNLHVSINESKEWTGLRDILDVTFSQHPEAKDTFLGLVRRKRLPIQRKGDLV